MERARIFWTGGSQAVRLPKAFRFEGQYVFIRRRGAAVILEPAPAETWAWLDAIIGKVDDDFIEAALESQQLQRRPELDDDSR